MLLMPGSWGQSRGLVQLQADRGSFPQPDRCDSQRRTQTGSARAHTRRLFPPKGKRNLLQHFQACFLKCHFCKSPGPVTAFWGGGDKYKKSCAYARNVRSRTGLGYYREFNEEEIQLSPARTCWSPLAPASRTCAPTPCRGKKGHHSQVTRSQHLWGREGT